MESRDETDNHYACMMSNNLATYKKKKTKNRKKTKAMIKKKGTFTESFPLKEIYMLQFDSQIHSTASPTY